MNVQKGINAYIVNNKPKAKPSEIIQNASFFKDLIAWFKRNKKILNLRHSAGFNIFNLEKNRGFEIIMLAYVGQKLKYLLGL